jgi:hypothetical protein
MLKIIAAGEKSDQFVDMPIGELNPKDSLQNFCF